jgi:hypothetical protein
MLSPLIHIPVASAVSLVQIFSADAGAAFWRNATAWGLKKRALTPLEASILDVAGGVPSRIPTERQCVKAVGILRKLHSEGFVEGLALFN